ncbi:hypothetical protein GOP47_0000284 [Adiantum capillus-veneris]|uniref:Protein CHAPERONE-LIKE PROTEIN OF POR1, chloroplastic n=1 Tax=Adiantum capillus-veneris TaxID=13818 RepID=A0A9D4ZSY1_ADICA|nr:hypothetical protein GOP47_0000284 [Adiantum capillus-veneris]
MGLATTKEEVKTKSPLVGRPDGHGSAQSARFLGCRELHFFWPGQKGSRHIHHHNKIVCALGGSSDEGYTAVFPRIYVRDPHKVLGVTRDASEEEIQSARNFLAEQYAHHERSREAVEAAHDKIIMESFRARKNSKINLKSNLKKKVEESPPWVKRILNIFEVPPSQIILQRAAFFGLMGVWSVMNPAEGGPAFQVAVSLAGCVYLLNYRLKSIGRSFMLGFGGLVVGWLVGSFIVPVVPMALLPPNWSLEIITALISYVFMWVACTFLK